MVVASSYTPGGLDDALSGILTLASEAQVPAIFSLRRRDLGKVFGKRASISIVSVLSADGANELMAVRAVECFVFVRGSSPLQLLPQP